MEMAANGAATATATATASPRWAAFKWAWPVKENINSKNKWNCDIYAFCELRES